MEKKIFRSIVTVAICVLLLCTFSIVQIVCNNVDSDKQNDLKTQTNYLATLVEKNGIDSLKEIDVDDNRITYISSNGEVKFDNKVEIKKLENHGDRKEFKDAIKYGYGTDSRLSKSLSVKTIYAAKRLANGAVIRTSMDEMTPLALTLALFQPLLIITFALLIGAAILASSVAKKIVKPINEINIDKPEDNDVYDEITPLLVRISKQGNQLQSQLKEAKQKQAEFTTITENMNEGIIVIDTKYEVLLYNKAIVNLFTQGKEPEGKSVFVFNRTGEFRNLIESALKAERAEAVLEIKEKSYEVIANPVFENEKVIGAVIVVMDVTEKIERESLRREFTANVSHELKTPLTSISGFAEIMKNGIVKSEDIPEMANRIYSEAQRLITLVNDIIKLSELEDYKISYEEEDINLSTLIEEIRDRLSNVIDKKNIDFIIETSDIKIKAPREIVSEMMYNICDNAIKYNKDGGRVKVNILKEGKDVRITVEDTGIGIAHSHQNRIFERFYRVDKSHSREVGGTGLGLSIVKHNVTYLNGKIELYSELGKGTKINIIIPKEKN